MFIDNSLQGEKILLKTSKGGFTEAFPFFSQSRNWHHILLPSPFLPQLSFLLCFRIRKHMDKTDDQSLDKEAISFLKPPASVKNLAFQCSNRKTDKNEHLYSLNLKGQF